MAANEVSRGTFTAHANCEKKVNCTQFLKGKKIKIDAGDNLISVIGEKREFEREILRDIFKRQIDSACVVLVPTEYFSQACPKFWNSYDVYSGVY